MDLDKYLADFEVVGRLFTLVKGLVDSIRSDYLSKRFPRLHSGYRLPSWHCFAILLAIASPQLAGIYDLRVILPGFGNELELRMDEHISDTLRNVFGTVVSQWWIRRLGLGRTAQ